MHYKQADIAEKHGWSRAKVKKLRDEHLEKDIHWWKEETVIWWNQEAVDIIEDAITPKGCSDEDESPHEEIQPDYSEVFEAFVISQHSNPCWVRGRVDGAGVDIQIPKKLGSKLVGKRIKIRKAENDGFTTYYQYIP